MKRREKLLILDFMLYAGNRLIEEKKHILYIYI